MSTSLLTRTMPGVNGMLTALWSGSVKSAYGNVDSVSH